MTSEQRLKALPGAIITWYGIRKGSRIACMVHLRGNSRLIAEALEVKWGCVQRIPIAQLCGGQEGQEVACLEKEVYDVVVAADVIEYTQNVPKLLRLAKSLLKPDGMLLLAADNRLGVRYFCGDRDFFTGKNYDSIENYRHLKPWERKEQEGRAYSKAELTSFLEEAGFSRHRFFSVFPRIANPQLLLAEDYKPNEALDLRVFPEYNHPGTVFLFEEELYPSLMENHLLHPMANGFFVECSLKAELISVNQVTLSAERGVEHAMATIIQRDGSVAKRALYPEGKKKLKKLMDSHKYLRDHGVCMVDMEMKGDSLVMPYVPGIPATDYFRRLLEKDKDAFLSRLEDFWEIILHSSEQDSLDKGCGGENLGVILERGYLDLVSLNCFSLNGKFIFYDQESYLEHIPARAILLRTIEFIYKFHDYLDGILPREELFERYGIGKDRDLYNGFIQNFLEELRGEEKLSDYFQAGRRTYETIINNRRRMNYSEEEYDEIFRDIFQRMEGCKLYLFGTGNYARRFCERYGGICQVNGYLDNDESRWGSEIEGIPVSAPSVLEGMGPEEYKVMVCIRDYEPVVRQLERAGVTNFSVYNPNA